MNRLILPSLLISFLITSCQQQQIETAEATTDATFSYLAKRRSMNVLSAGGQNLGKAGSTYALQSPSTERDMDRYADAGRPIQITPYQKDLFPANVEVQEETRYQIQEQLASHIGGALKAQIKEQGGSVEGFVKKLKSANSRFKVTRHAAYEHQVQQALATAGVAYQQPNIPRRAGGLITPVEYLTVSDFTFDAVDQTTTEGKLAANYLEQLKVNLEIKRTNSSDVKVGIDEARIIAIRPMSLVFRE